VIGVVAICGAPVGAPLALSQVVRGPLWDQAFWQTTPGALSLLHSCGCGCTCVGGRA